MRVLLKAVVTVVVIIAALWGVFSAWGLYLNVTANPGAPDVIQFWAAWADLQTVWHGLVDTVMQRAGK
jgi:hypothetical protein